MFIERDEEIGLWVAYVGDGGPNGFCRDDGENPCSTCYGLTYDGLIAQVWSYFCSVY